MNDFIDRLSISESFERIFIEIFNKYCKNYKIVKFGIEHNKSPHSPFWTFLVRMELGDILLFYVLFYYV